jgi:hypothetical protein
MGSKFCRTKQYFVMLSGVVLLSSIFILDSCGKKSASSNSGLGLPELQPPLKITYRKV